MFLNNDSDTVLIRLLEDGYIRSHIKEVEEIQATSGTYFTLYGDGKRIDQGTNKKIDIKNEISKKQYKKFRIFTFNTDTFPHCVNFTAQSKDYKAIKGQITFNVRLDNRKITSAESLETSFKESKGNKVFTSNDLLQIFSSYFQKTLLEYFGEFESSRISEDKKAVCKGFEKPEDVSEWCSVHGFTITKLETSVTYNEYDEERKEDLKKEKKKKDEEEKKRDAEEKRKRDLEDIETQNKIEAERAKLNEQKLKYQIDEETGESKATTVFKKMYSKVSLYGIMNTEECYESDDYIIYTEENRCSIISLKINQSEVKVPGILSDGEQEWDVTDVGPKVFGGGYSKNIVSIVIGEGVIRIDDRAFQGCSNLRSITLPESLESIGANSFTGCTKLEKISIPDNVHEIDPMAFSACPLKEIELPAGYSGDNLLLPVTTRIKHRVSET